ncbi:hypothetical protein PIB30_047821 [Stylosanthes scabra]|uniref:Putative plant transposon protein domain-containing protein n=1 Tax=Stylosanthes scabra TaxID=79078 RepID=A0ABU6ZFL8_9FABA|nr:hypothetical protein [Stylosanthes scabra]
MAPKSRKRNASDAPSSSQIPDTSPEPTYDATRFKSLAHEKHFEEVVQFILPIPEVLFSLKKNEFRHIKDDITTRGWDLLFKPPQKKMGIMLLREFYANARMTRREKQSNPHYTTFVRGKEIDFSPASIKVILKLPDIGDSEQSYEARRQADDQRLNDVLRDIVPHPLPAHHHETVAAPFLRHAALCSPHSHTPSSLCLRLSPLFPALCSRCHHLQALKDLRSSLFSLVFFLRIGESSSANLQGSSPTHDLLIAISSLPCRRFISARFSWRLGLESRHSSRRSSKLGF